MKQTANCSHPLFDGLPEKLISDKISAVSNYMFEMHHLASISKTLQAEPDVPTQLPFFAIIWVKKGAGTISIDIENYNIHSNSIICVSPGQFLLFADCNNLDGYFISFSEEFLLMADRQTNGSFRDILYEKRNLPIINSDELTTELDDIITMMNKEFSNYGLLRIQALNGYLKIFIVYLSEKIKRNEQDFLSDRDTEIVHKFLSLVKNNFLTKKMVVDYAEELAVSPNYLNRIVKKISGYTASYHIQQCIIMEAKRQAIYSTLSLKEVAYYLGFNDYAHFSKFFKNNSGMNFTCFKKSLKIN